MDQFHQTTPQLPQPSNTISIPNLSTMGPPPSKPFFDPQPIQEAPSQQQQPYQYYPPDHQPMDALPQSTAPAQSLLQMQQTIPQQKSIVAQLKAKQGSNTTITTPQNTKVTKQPTEQIKGKSNALDKAKWEGVDLQENYVGLQAQNLYLVNYLNKLEFLLEQSVKDRKREKKARERKLGVIVRAVSERVQGKGKGDDQVLKYYLGLTKGLNDGKGDDFDSDEESPGNEDSDFSEKMGIERKLIRPQIKPDAKHLLHKDKKDESLLHIFKFQNQSADHNQGSGGLSSTVKKDNSSDDEDDEEKKKQEREITEDFLKREVPIHHFGSEINSKVFNHATSSTITEDDVAKQLRFIRRKTKGSLSKPSLKKKYANKDESSESSDDAGEYQVSDFVKTQWHSLARVNAKLNPTGAQKGLEGGKV